MLEGENPRIDLALYKDHRIPALLLAHQPDTYRELIEAVQRGRNAPISPDLSR